MPFLKYGKSHYLNNSLNHRGNFGEHDSKPVGPLCGLKLGSVMGAGPVASCEVERVSRCQFELGRRGLNIGDYRVQESILGFFEKFKDCRQYGVLSPWLTLVLGQSVSKT